MSQHYQQMQLDYDVDYSYNSTASTITTAANIYPYVTNGTGGYTLSTSGTGGYSWSDLSNQSDAKLKVIGDAEFEGDVRIKGKSLTEALGKIEERLGILYPNEKLEERWEELKKLGDAYRTLEKEILEKEKIWDTLKK